MAHGEATACLPASHLLGRPVAWLPHAPASTSASLAPVLALCGTGALGHGILNGALLGIATTVATSPSAFFGVWDAEQALLSMQGVALAALFLPEAYARKSQGFMIACG